MSGSCDVCVACEMDTDVQRLRGIIQYLATSEEGVMQAEILRGFIGGTAKKLF